MRARFHAEPIIQATELLLQERTPRDVAVAHPRAEEVKADANVRESAPPTIRRFHSPHDLIPRTHLLVQRQLHRDDHRGRLGLQPLARDGGHAMARRRHLRFVGNLHLRSRCAERQGLVGRFPAGGVEADSYEVEFSEDRAEIVRRDGTTTTTLEVAVSPEDDAEVRRVSITNLGSRVREVELTSYAEIVLATEASDTAHPAFSKMFVQTEFDADVGAILATRRLRSPTEVPVWAAHLAVTEGESVGEMQFETDRARFLGRGRESPRRRFGDRRTAALGYRRHRARSDLQRSPAYAHPGRSDRARRVLDHRRAVADRSARPGRQASRLERVRARGDAGVDAGASAIASPAG